MKVLLSKDVQGLGRAGEIKDVSDGHARNYLIPKHLVLPATSAVLAQYQKEEKERQTRFAKEQERFLALKNKLDGKSISLKAKASGKSLFAAVHEKEISQVIMEKLGIEIFPNIIKIKSPLKNLGQHEVELNFTENIKAKLFINLEGIN